jgi:hypothetical protein
LKHVVEMGLGAMTSVHTSLHKDWFGHSTVDKGATKAHRQYDVPTNLPLFSPQNKESRLMRRTREK